MRVHDMHRGMGRRVLAVMALALLAGPLPAGQQAARPGSVEGGWAILIAGISGDEKLQADYIATIRELHSLFAGGSRFPREQILVLLDEPAKAPDLPADRSTRDGLARACRQVAAKAGKDSLVLVFILGHGSSDGSGYKLNLVGPDPAAEELAAMLDSIPAGTLVVVNATSASGASVRALSGERRVVVSATKSGNERNLTQMARYFVESLRDNAADADKDLRVSVLEAYRFAARRVQEHYAREGRIQTEHAVLEDNGDGAGHDNPSPENGDGLLARTTFLAAAAGAAGLWGAGEAALVREAEAVQKEIEALKYSKDRMEEKAYQDRLEELLLRLARIHAKLQK